MSRTVQTLATTIAMAAFAIIAALFFHDDQYGLGVATLGLFIGYAIYDELREIRRTLERQR